MAVYTVYNLTKLALTLLTACDDNEMDMGVKIGQRQCFSVGDRYCSKDVLGVCYQRRQSYCCYSSILARIVMKESYVQLGIDPLPYGTQPGMNNGEAAESCRGFTPAELADVDFSDPSMETALQECMGLLP
jgi:conjugal transfer mating pair stabilization protein TraN